MLLLSTLFLNANAIQSNDQDLVCEAFLLSSTLPSDQATDVPIDARLLQIFSGIGECDSNTFTMTLTTESEVLFDEVVAVDRNNGLSTIKPSQDLEAFTEHTLTITPSNDDLGWEVRFTTGEDRVTPPEAAPILTVHDLQAWTSDGDSDYSAYWHVEAEVSETDLALLHIYDADDRGQPLATSLPWTDRSSTPLWADWSDLEEERLCFVATIEDGSGAEAQVSEERCKDVEEQSTGRFGCQAAPAGGGLLSILLALAAPLLRRRQD